MGFHLPGPFEWGVLNHKPWYQQCPPFSCWGDQSSSIGNVLVGTHKQGGRGGGGGGGGGGTSFACQLLLDSQVI